MICVKLSNQWRNWHTMGRQAAKLTESMGPHAWMEFC